MNNNVNVTELDKLVKKQKELAKKVIIEDRFDMASINYIAGIDQAFPDKDTIISGIVVLDYKTLQPVEKIHIRTKVTFPYIPGFLSFREGPAIIKAYKKLKLRPDILMIDANGILHPRRIGLASHVGVLLNRPTIGVAKSLLCGEQKGDHIVMNDEKIGYRLVSKIGCKPIFISSGHMVSLESSVVIVKHCLAGYRLPEPTRLAHKYVNEVKNKLRSVETLYEH
ncbi:MAG: endonuclease V [Candidatus Aenigmarchaeota archaeon ex4484_14]|nr:MAG: endonuclease V [Candidatus Aenigmarchaeota archaeon ex4484_14]